MRYVLGPFVDFVRPDPTPVPKADTIVTIAGTTDATITLAFEKPAAEFNFPAELRVYLAAAGSSLPATADEWVASTFPVSVCFPGNPDVSSCEIAVPDVAPGTYLTQVVIGFLDN